MLIVTVDHNNITYAKMQSVCVCVCVQEGCMHGFIAVSIFSSSTFSVPSPDSNYPSSYLYFILMCSSIT